METNYVWFRIPKEKTLKVGNDWGKISKSQTGLGPFRHRSTVGAGGLHRSAGLRGGAIHAVKAGAQRGCTMLTLARYVF